MEATRIAAARGADEAVLVRPDGIVLEAPTSAVFWVSPEGGLRTPSLDTGILDSITRDRIARELHVEEGAWPIEDLSAAREAFLASTTREVQAISAIDGASWQPRSAHRRGGRCVRAGRRAGAGRRTQIVFRRMDLDLTDEQRLIQEDGARVRRPRDRATRAGQRPRRPLRPRAGAQDRRDGISRRPRRRGVRRPRPRLRDLRPDRGAGRARDSSARTVVSVQTSLVCGSIERWGTEEQKREWLPRLCSGEALGCFALTEPDAGSDAASLRTRATRSDGGWVISGQKMLISLGNYAELALVFAQTDPEKGHRGLACFLVPTSDDGYHAQEIHGKLGLRASDTGGDLARRRRGAGRRDARRGRRRVQGRDERARQRALQRRRRLRRDLRGVRRRVGLLLDRAQAVRGPGRALPARPGADRGHGR